MTTIALLGAGGKMGMRLARNLKNSRFKIHPVEINPQAQEKIKSEFGWDCVDCNIALQGAEIIIMAVPDTVIGAVAKEIVPTLRKDTIVVILDAAAPHAGHLPERKDITYFITHPCHPPIFNDETDLVAKADHFGGIVNALMQGPESHYALGEEVARAIWAPVMRSHRISVEHMAILEPGLSETVCATLLSAMRDAMDETIRRGVPKEAARDFLLGHMNILAAVTFDEINGQFSDACNKAIIFGKETILKPDWLRLFESEEIKDSVKRIT